LYLLVLIAALFVAVGYVMLEKIIRHHQPWWALLLLFPLGAVKVYTEWLKMCYPQSVLFDRGAKRVVFGRGMIFGKRTSGRPFDTIAAVQLVPFPVGDPGGQLHLVLTDLNLPRTSARALPRLRITQGRKLEDLRDIGCRLATFLGVPLLDQSLAANGTEAT
jgi:hypothetical protein